MSEASASQLVIKKYCLIIYNNYFFPQLSFLLVKTVNWTFIVKHQTDSESVSQVRQNILMTALINYLEVPLIISF